MSEIKSALEIAMERTADIKSDASAGTKRENQNIGKKIASEFMDSQEEINLKKEFAQYKGDVKQMVLEGAINLFLTRIQLPAEEEDLKTLVKVGTALETLLPHKGIRQLFETAENIFSQYLASIVQLEQNLQQQYMPKLRQKEAELAKRTGQHITLSPDQDPEYVQLLKRSQEQLQARYEEAVKDMRARIKEAAGE